ncbi:Abscisic acid receptor PYL9 [Linum grandiflorum]
MTIINGDCGSALEAQCIWMHHRHQTADNQCSSNLVMHIKAPVDIVWSLVRRFDEPQTYKPFISRCVINGEVGIGSLRHVNVRSGLPATTSTERLELFDDEQHILGIKIIDGDHRLKNYSSVITVHPELIDARPGTLVIESFVVDVPHGNTKEDTSYFVRALINCNLRSLTEISERMALPLPPLRPQ